MSRQLHESHTFEKKIQTRGLRTVGNRTKEQLRVPNTVAPDPEGPLGPEQDGRTVDAVRIDYQRDALFDTGMLGDTVSALVPLRTVRALLSLNV